MYVVENQIIAANGQSLGRLNPVDMDYTSVDHVEWTSSDDEVDAHAAHLWI